MKIYKKVAKGKCRVFFFFYKLSYLILKEMCGDLPGDFF